MKIRRIRAIPVGIVFLLILCTAGCGSQSEEALQQGDAAEQYAGTELPTEGPVESSSEDLIDVPIENDATEETLKPDREVSVTEIIKTLNVEGCPLPIPCKVEDMGEGLSLGRGVTVDEITTCTLIYQGNEVGSVFMQDVSVATDQLVDMSSGYEEAWITAFSMTTYGGGTFEMFGITMDLTMEDVIKLWGEPDIVNGHYITYCDINEETGERIAGISFNFNDSHGKITSILVVDDELMEIYADE